MADVPRPTARPALVSWKAIAAYLKVDVRTAQRWLKKTDIPIYHQGGRPKGRPVAYPDELDHWTVQRTPADRTGTEQGRASHRVPAAVWGVLSLAALLLAAYAWVRLVPGEPVRARVEGDRFIVVDAQGRVCWQRSFPELPTASRWAPVAPPVQSHYVGELAGDGHPEVLLNVPPDGANGVPGRLFAFDYRGHERWHAAYGGTLRWEGREFSNSYGGHVLRIVHGRERSYILTVASHILWFPSQVALWDPATGKKLEEYWHPGVIQQVALHDLDGDHVDELVLAGINNPGQGLGHSGLVALHLPFGPRRAPVGTEMADFSGGREVGYLLFPRSDVCTATGQIPRVSDLLIEARDRLVVTIACDTASVVYTLNLNLRPIDVRLSDNFESTHRRLEAAGLLTHSLAPAESECLKRVVTSPVTLNGNDPRFVAYWKGCQ